MIPRYQNPMQNRMMPRHFPQSMGRPPVNQMRRMAPQMQQKGGGGLLSKILGKGNTANTGKAMNHASRALGATNPAAGGGGLLKSLANPTALNGFLTNTQKVLSTAQQVGPLVEQYGPLVKNLPAMWRLYRGLKDAPELDESNEESPSTANSTSLDTNNESERTENVSQESNQEDRKSNRTQSLPSRPKLYI